MDDTKKTSENVYSASSIKVLEGLDAVRKRPAMYIGSTGAQGLHHLVYEVVDNSVDEALAGFCTDIKVVLHTDGSCSVEDNGRGIPTDTHPGEGISAAEVVLTKLHAGGKFDKDSYKFSGGLHGVGISVVNALSKKLRLTIYQNGIIYQQNYEHGKPTGPLTPIGKTTKRGTVVRFLPDEAIFQETTDFNFDILSSRLRELAFLNKKLRISIVDERTSKSHEFYFEGGIVSFVEHINSKKTPLFPEVMYFFKEEANFILEVAMQYNDGYGEQLFSFVNNINTVEGGTHVSGFKTALTRASNKKALELGLLKQNDSFSSEDVREGLVAVISVKVAEPQFEGQTKTKLGNSEVKGIVESAFFPFLETYFEENPAVTKKILQKAEVAKRARDAAKKARELTRRKTVLESTVLPGQLTDCSNENPSESELFIVEGESAGGSAKGARDRNTQAILPLRGKILNVEKARFDTILSSEQIKILAIAIGCGVGNQECVIEKARYHKIILMTDADVDGAHIRTLLLTFLFRYMKPIIEAGYVYIAQPPLYRAKIGKKEQYLKDEAALKKFIMSWAQESTQLILSDNLMQAKEWHDLLEKLMVYEIELEKAGVAFRLTTEQVHALLLFLATHTVDFQNVDDWLPKLRDNFRSFAVAIRDESFGKKLIVFERAGREWTVSLDFFESALINELKKQREALSELDAQWILRVVDKEKQIAGAGVMDVLKAITALSNQYMTIMRYKGLGEMNADQLGESAMNVKTRQLLQVSVQDALEADAWFDTLMGDDVAGRKKFIEENGHFVKNLDV